MHPATTASNTGINALVDCLEAEYQALLDEDCTRLEAVLAQKERLLAELAAQSNPALGAARDGRPRWPTPGRQALVRLRELNNRNALLLAPRALANGARLRFLQSALGRGPAVYAVDGATTPFQRAGR
jgi:flagellar biosynthesis/type III secretory pathway chaperone